LNWKYGHEDRTELLERFVLPELGLFRILEFLVEHIRWNLDAAVTVEVDLERRVLFTVSKEVGITFLLTAGSKNEPQFWYFNGSSIAPGSKRDQTISPNVPPAATNG
jgi:hypothetical protein